MRSKGMANKGRLQRVAFSLVHINEGQRFMCVRAQKQPALEALEQGTSIFIFALCQRYGPPQETRPRIGRRPT